MEVPFVASVTRARSGWKSRKVNKRFELQMLQKAGAGADSRLDFVFTILSCRDALAGEDYFRDFTKVAPALASSLLVSRSAI